jgi:predicted small metal-binding protein
VFSIFNQFIREAIMPKTVGCSDFNEDCSFRITADAGQEDMMVDVATSHAMEHHPEFAAKESEFRTAIRSQIKSLMSQAHMSEDEIAEVKNTLLKDSQPAS